MASASASRSDIEASVAFLNLRAFFNAVGNLRILFFSRALIIWDLITRCGTPSTERVLTVSVTPASKYACLIASGTSLSSDKRNLVPIAIP